MKEIAIKIDDEVYERLFTMKPMDLADKIAIDMAIKNGKVLPKGHGDLVDISPYKGKVICQHLYSGVKKLIEVDSIEPILEANKEYEVEVVTRGNCMVCGKELTEGLFFCKECEDKVRNGTWQI